MTDKTYTQAELDAEVLGLKNKNNELLEKQSKHSSQLDSLNNRLSDFEGVDISALKELAKNAKTSEEAEMLKAGQFTELMQIKLDEQSKAFTNQIESLKGDSDRYKSEAAKSASELSVTKRDNFIRSGASTVGDLHDTAVNDLLLRGSSSWKEVDGNFSLFDGDKQLFKEGKPIEFNGWVDSLRETSPHLFNAAKGTGSNDSDSGGKDVARFFDRASKDYNVTEQAKISKSDPGQYQALSSKYA